MNFGDDLDFCIFSRSAGIVIFVKIDIFLPVKMVKTQNLQKLYVLV